MLSPGNVKQSLKVDVAITPLMADALQKWSLMYVNQSPWLNGEIKSLNLAASIAAEVARAVTIEMEVQISGSPRADFLAEQMIPVMNSIRTYTEYCSAKGGLMFKPYIKGEYICVDYVQADMFYPVAFDSNGNMTSCIFADQKTVGNNTFYTRLEFHSFGTFNVDGQEYQGCKITNTAYKSTTRETLGNQVALTEVPEWADLETEVTILNIDRPLFAYFRMPFANNIDSTSPLGVSVYSRAVNLIEQADRQWSDFLWEFESGKRAVYTDVAAFGKTSDNKPVLPDKRLYRLLDLQGKLDAPGFFHDWTPTLREVNILNGLDAILKQIEFQCGLAQGTISDSQNVALTATEIKMSKQRTFATITDTQKALQDAIDGLLNAMDVWATIGQLAPEGTYTATYQFDDSIVTDHDSQFIQDQQAVTSGNMPKYIFNMRNFGLDEKTAKQWVTDAQAESPAPTSFFGNELGV